MKIVTILGARPQFIKAAAVSRAIASHNFQSSTKINEVILHTGQHYDANMSRVFFDEMEIPAPAYQLDINQATHTVMTARMMEGIEPVLIDEKPDFVLVYGDTNSTLAGALVAGKMHIPIAHVEAGLRSFNMKMPEEINRVLTDRISSLLFCPTPTAVGNLENEGFNHHDCQVILCGDVMMDGSLYYGSQSAKKSDICQKMGLETGKFVLATLHRPENSDDAENLSSVFKALDAIHAKNPVVLPLHPRTRKKMEQFDVQTNVRLLDPVGYFDMLELLQGCRMVLTDSGGLQKESFFFQKPCITLRNETEWIELADNRFSALAGSRYEDILECYHHFDFNRDYNQPIFGEGNASEQIVKGLCG